MYNKIFQVMLLWVLPVLVNLLLLFISKMPSWHQIPRESANFVRLHEVEQLDLHLQPRLRLEEHHYTTTPDFWTGEYSTVLTAAAAVKLEKNKMVCCLIVNAVDLNFPPRQVPRQLLLLLYNPPVAKAVWTTGQLLWGPINHKMGPICYRPF